MTVLRSGSATDVGRVRTVNQDLALERPNLYAVADGMGGHVGGEVAARVAVETLEQAFERVSTVDGLRDAFSEANAAVWHESQANADLRGMGTTLTAMALVGGTGGRDVLALANVGDSRAYVFSGDELIQVTDDHSLAEERMRHGEMTEAEAAVHPQRHILTRALGVGAEVDADMWELELHSGDRVLLCSDGLSNEVGTDEMADVLRTADDPEEAARRLVGAANEYGGADNITVVVVDVQVGEGGEGEGTAARVTPLAVGAVLGAAATAAVPVTTGPVRPESSANDVRMDDTLAPGRGSASATTRPRWRWRARAATSSSWGRPPPCPWPARPPGCPSRPRRGGSAPRRRAVARAVVVSGSRVASRRAWWGSSCWSPPCRSRPTSCCAGTPTTTGWSRCRATRSWSSRASRAACCGSTPRWWTGRA